ncbi:uncharacterized protein JN550_010888 [Neoarthrinium moseri]|uniref:uncharacterized protein n=1 Tax=Neoarthrinium moseri TaxID=1658444 RepID=UPI001FDDD360|nr:uncharacterized protein JN550_010888 [Neoarthrinium moseri]KAI1861358.1 hypothetical protein JN550_010888 [Neoarthrinium moseri]
MRPLPGDDAFGRRRPAESQEFHSVNPGASQMSFFLADEATVDSLLDQPSVGPSRIKDHRKYAESRHALPSRAVEADAYTYADADADTSRARDASRPRGRQRDLSYSPLSVASLPSPTPVPAASSGHAPLSRPMTPITLGTSVTGSVMSTPSSRRNSFSGFVSENAISSDDEGETPMRPTSDLMMDSGSAPQLVMPSIKMPSRRPFTETGKSLGRLKVLIAGKSGVGKTSLVKAMVQTCDHIVHVDPIIPHPDSRRSSKATVRPSAARRRSSAATEGISEIFASTKSYPEWWTELDDSRSSQRRKSLGDQVLDRNVCFVDTPGYGTGSSAMETIVPCVDYVESHLNKLASDSLSDSEMLKVLGGDGGFQVDVVLYLVQRSLSPADFEYLKRLSSLTNVIPLLAQTDRLSAEEQAVCKQEVLGQLREAGIRPFSFITSLEQMPEVTAIDIPYAVSSATGSDHDVMDASLLMSPDYVQPLVSSELGALVDHLFSPNGSSWLRHSAAKKYMQWRNSPNPSRPRHLYRPLSLPGPGAGALVGPTSLALARISEQPNDNGPVQLHLVDWAADLQRSLSSERARYEALARGERALWLTERLNDCIKDGTLVPVKDSKEPGSAQRRRRRGPQARKTSRHQDPLGLLQVAADLKAKGWIALEVLGSLGILGGIAFWMTRQRWQADSPVQFADEWARMWGLDI